MKGSVYSSRSSLYSGLFENGFRRTEKGAECALYAAIYALLAAFPFQDLLIVDVWVFGAYDLLLVLSVLGARARLPERRSGFMIPAGLAGVWANTLVVAATWVVVLYSTARQQPRDA